jgi:uncharacterized surface protein with fasciclin (FAS1) repeats
MKFIAVAAALVAFAFASASAQTSPSNTIVGNAIAIPELSTLVSIVASPGYEEVLKALNNPAANLTLFAPNNAAFAKLPAVPDYETLLAVLYYHVVPARVRSTDLGALQFPSSLMSNASLVNIGAGKAQVLEVIKANGAVDVVFGIPGSPTYTARVTTADIACSNGFIHIINLVLLPPATASATAIAAGLNNLAYALTVTGLLDTVDALTAITVFAPTDAAFDAIPGWRTLPIATLTNILLYHVVPAVAYSTSLVDGQVVPTLQGQTLRITTVGGVKVNGVDVVLANALIKNGVVHVIDEVLLPAKKF